MSNEAAVSLEGRSTRRYCYRETGLFLIIEKEPEVAACDVVLLLLLLRARRLSPTSMETKAKGRGRRRGDNDEDPAFDRGNIKQRGSR